MVQLFKSHSAVSVKFSNDEEIVIRAVNELFREVVDPTCKAKEIFFKIMTKRRGAGLEDEDDVYIQVTFENEHCYFVTVHIPTSDTSRSEAYVTALSKANEVLPEMLKKLLKPFVEAARDYAIQQILNDA